MASWLDIISKGINKHLLLSVFPIISYHGKIVQHAPDDPLRLPLVVESQKLLKCLYDFMLLFIKCEKY